MKYDFIIVGGGLGGATAALALSQQHRVLLVDAREPDSASAAAAAGMVNPLMSLRARPVWEMEAALGAFDRLLDRSGAADLFNGPGLLRPAASAQQAADFAVSADEQPGLAEWIGPAAAATQHPWLHAPLGLLHIRRGGGISIPALLNSVLGAVTSQGGIVQFGKRLNGWHEDSDCVTVRMTDVDGTSTQLLTRRLVLATGAGYARVEQLKELNLHPVKGQLVRVHAPGCEARMLPVAGRTYVIPEGNSLLIGSTYEHRFEDTAPRRAVSRRLLAQAQKVVPCIADAEILGEYAGLRVTVPGIRLPMVGPLQIGSRAWIITGLGSRGLLTAPLIAERLQEWLSKPEAVPVRFAVKYRF